MYSARSFSFSLTRQSPLMPTVWVLLVCCVAEVAGCSRAQRGDWRHEQPIADIVIVQLFICVEKVDVQIVGGPIVDVRPDGQRVVLPYALTDA